MTEANAEFKSLKVTLGGVVGGGPAAPCRWRQHGMGLVATAWTGAGGDSMSWGWRRQHGGGSRRRAIARGGGVGGAPARFSAPVRHAGRRRRKAIAAAARGGGVGMVGEFG